MNQQEEINKLAAKSLLNRALEVKTQGCANMLIDTAKRLDETIDTVSLKSVWLDAWMWTNRNRSSTVNVTL